MFENAKFIKTITEVNNHCRNHVAWGSAVRHCRETQGKKESHAAQDAENLNHGPPPLECKKPG
jgi:hypothetical protein